MHALMPFVIRHTWPHAVDGKKGWSRIGQKNNLSNSRTIHWRAILLHRFYSSHSLEALKCARLPVRNGKLFHARAPSIERQQSKYSERIRQHNFSSIFFSISYGDDCGCRQLKYHEQNATFNVWDWRRNRFLLPILRNKEHIRLLQMKIVYHCEIDEKKWKLWQKLIHRSQEWIYNPSSGTVLIYFIDEENGSKRHSINSIN